MSSKILHTLAYFLNIVSRVTNVIFICSIQVVTVGMSQLVVIEVNKITSFDSQKNTSSNLLQTKGIHP